MDLLLTLLTALIVGAGCGVGGSEAEPVLSQGKRRMRRDGGFSLAELLEADDARIGGDAAGGDVGGEGGGDNYDNNQQQQRPEDYYNYNVGPDVPAYNNAANAYQPDYSNAFPASNYGFAFPTEAPHSAAAIQAYPNPSSDGQSPLAAPVEIYIDEAGLFQVRNADDDPPPQPRTPTPSPQGLLLEQTGAYATYDGRPVFSD